MKKRTNQRFGTAGTFTDGLDRRREIETKVGRLVSSEKGPER